MTIAEKYREEHNINDVITDLANFDYYSEYQNMLGELINYIELLEELLGETK